MLRVPAPRETDAGTEPAPDHGPAFTPPSPRAAPPPVRRLRNASGHAAAQLARRRAAARPRPKPEPAAIPADLRAEDEDQRADEAEIEEIEREVAEASADADAVEQDVAVTAKAATASASAADVPKTDAGIRRIRSRWQRHRDAAARVRDRARRRQEERRDERRERVARRRRMSARKRRAEERRRDLRAKRERLERRRERLQNRGGAKGTTARAASIGGGLGDVLDWVKKAIKKVVDAIKKVARLLVALARLIVRLARAIRKETSLIGKVIRALKKVGRTVVRAAKRVVRWAKKLASKLFKPFGFDRTGPPPGAKGTRRVEGVVFREDGVDMWPQPNRSGQPLGRLDHGRKLFVLNRDLPGGWAHVTTDKGSNGYVPSSVVKTDLPCPGARLWRIPNDTTALAIARRFYGDQVKPGRDLRFYVNVLQYVNQRDEGRAGIEKARDSDSWKHVKAYSGFSIWVPTAEFANTLEGTVDDGSITNGLWARAKGAFNAVVDILIGGPAFVYGLLKGAVLTITETLVGLGQLIGTVIDLVKSIVTGNIVSDLKGLWNELKQLDIKGALGSLWKEFKGRWNAKNPMDRWAFRGEVIGRVITEVLLIVFTGGVAAVVSGTSKFARLTAAVSKLRSVQKLERAARREQHRVPAVRDALRQKIRGGRRSGDADAEARSRQRNETKPGSGTPRALPWRKRTAGKGAQVQLLRDHAQAADRDGAWDIRVDQAQVAAGTKPHPGNRLGNNRPDLQYTDRNGRRHYVEYDSYRSRRGRAHLRRILSNDPDGVIELWQEIRFKRGGKLVYEYTKVF